MGICIFAVLCIISIFIFLKKRIYRVVYLRKLVLPAICMFFILCLIIFSKTALNSAAKGINLWLNIVFPSLFPFFVASSLLNGTGFIKAVGVLLEPVMRPLFNVPGCGSFAFVMGITSGYPVGAKITAEMRKDRLLTKTEAERLLAFSNNSGPLFIVGAVAAGMFKMPQAGVFLLACHIAACITVGILLRFYGRSKDSCKIDKSYNMPLLSRFKKELFSNRRRSQAGFASAFGDAIRDSIATMLTIGGFIILFSVIINLLLELGVIYSFSAIISFFLLPLDISFDIVASVMSGIFEITTGINMASKTAGVPLLQQFAATSFIAGWAGLSVHSQVLSIVSETDISLKPYFLGKFLQGFFASIYTLIGLKAAGHLFLGSRPASVHIIHYQALQWYEYLLSSSKYLLASVALLMLMSAISCIAGFIIKTVKG